MNFKINDYKKFLNRQFKKKRIFFTKKRICKKYLLYISLRFSKKLLKKRVPRFIKHMASIKRMPLSSGVLRMTRYEKCQQ